MPNHGLTLPEDYHPIYAEMLVNIYDSLIGSGINKDKAHSTALKAVERVRISWSGVLMYIPKNKGHETSGRDRAIFEKFTGNNVRELAKEYSLAQQTIYKILKKQRQSSRNKS